MQKGITWIFNPLFKSHHGAVWKRLLRLVRKELNFTLKKKNVSTESTHFEKSRLLLIAILYLKHPLIQMTWKRWPQTISCFLSLSLYCRQEFFKMRTCMCVVKDKRSARPTRFGSVGSRGIQLDFQSRSGIVPDEDTVVTVDESAPHNSLLTGRDVHVIPDKGRLVHQICIQTKSN